MVGDLSAFQGATGVDVAQSVRDVGPMETAQSLLKAGHITQEAFDNIKKQVEKVGFTTVQAARMIQNSQIEKEFKSLGNFVKKAKAGLIDSEAINSKVQSTFASFVKNGKNEEGIFKRIAKLREVQVQKRQEEFAREIKVLKEARDFELNQKIPQDLTEALTKAQEGLSSFGEINQVIGGAIQTFIE